MFYTQTNDEEEEAFNILNQGFAFIARAFSKFANKSNNHLRTSSNTRNQAVTQDGRVEVQNRNYGRPMGNGGYTGIQEVDKCLMPLVEIGTMQVLLREGLKLLRLEIHRLGIR